jgi:pimeloyl-ACP methyl ester carboxylesterase
MKQVFEERSTPLGRCALAYTLWNPSGARGTVVAVHGLNRQKRDFDYIAGHLAGEGYRVLCVDAPGRGGSTNLPEADDYQLDVYAYIFAAFLEKEKLKDVHWIGTSMGGLIALAMAQKGQAGAFRTLTLVDITHKPNFDACMRISEYLSDRPQEIKSVEDNIAFTKSTLGLGDVPESVWRHFAEHQLVKTETGYMLHSDPKILQRAKIDLAVPIDLTEGLKTLDCPIALIAGEKSGLCTAQEIRDFLDLKPGAQLMICPTAGHIPSLSDAPAQEFCARFMGGM